MKRVTTLAFLLVAIASQAPALNIRGALSNFDVWNDDSRDSCGFEIEIHGGSSSDVFHTYNYSAFGAPTVTDTSFNGQAGVLIRYYSETARVNQGMYTHFGVSLNRLFDQGSIIRNWLYPGASQNQVIKKPTVLPEWHSELVTLSDGSQAIRDGVFNPAPDLDTSPIFFVDIYNNARDREITLEELMQDDPTFTGAEYWGREQLDPQNFWYDDDLASESGEHSDIFSYKVYGSQEVNGQIEADTSRLLAVIMNGTVTAVPEPGSMAVLGLGVFALLRRRK